MYVLTNRALLLLGLTASTISCTTGGGTTGGGTSGADPTEDFSGGADFGALSSAGRAGSD